LEWLQEACASPSNGSVMNCRKAFGYGSIGTW
jgi:hypothetical protein